MSLPDLRRFTTLAARGNAVVLHRRLMSDQLTPVTAYRRLVMPDERTAPSFLLESVETGGSVGRYSFIGARPDLEIVARGKRATLHDHRRGENDTRHCDDPLRLSQEMTADWTLAVDDHEPKRPRFIGGWVGYAGYDTVRYLEPQALPFSSAPADDRDLPDMHLGLYRRVVVFDHVDKMIHAFALVLIDEHDGIESAHRAGCDELEQLVAELQTPRPPLAAGEIELDLSALPAAPMASNFSRERFETAVGRVQEYIRAGDAFQVVISQRFQRHTSADPFDIYRALRVVNPSPYMIYLQARGSILVASSPEILCRTEGRVVTNRPLAGTRRRGRSEQDDQALAEQLVHDPKERAEHVMLVDLGRNDLGRVCEPGTIDLPRVLEVERYSHVMHLSSTVTGELRDGCSSWDALRSTLPVGTVSGAPKIRAMQIIDELEPSRRGPYAGGIGAVGLTGDMDIALALRTMVIPTDRQGRDDWTVHLQAGAGIVADSIPAAEYDETVNKAAALGRAIDLAEAVFGHG